MDWLQLAAKWQISSLLVVFGFSLHACELQDSTDRMETSICIQNFEHETTPRLFKLFPGKRETSTFCMTGICHVFSSMVFREPWTLAKPRHVDLGLLEKSQGVGRVGALMGGENWNVLFWLVVLTGNVSSVVFLQ